MGAHAHGGDLVRGCVRGTPRDGAGALCMPVVDSGAGAIEEWIFYPLGLETVAPASTKRPGEGTTFPRVVLFVEIR